MRSRIINYMRSHPIFLQLFWGLMQGFLNVLKYIIRPQQKTMLFSSFGGRSFDDSPKAIYDEVCSRSYFDDWRLIWVFTKPDQFDIPRGEKVKIDTWPFFKALLYSKVWVGNSGITRGIKLKRKNVINVATWHGTPLKKICGDEHQNTLGGKKKKQGPLDHKSIRCAQSEYDQELFARLFHADKDSILLCDLPRNDSLLTYTKDTIDRIRAKLFIPKDKQVILYIPTYREYLVDEKKDYYLAPPMDLNKWKERLGQDYVLLFRAHYAITAALNLQENDFVINVSNYPKLNDLYAIADIMVSDYSSAYFDFAILDKPMLCFAYDREEYEEKRGLYLNMDETLPCPIDRDEDSVIEHIISMDKDKMKQKAKEFHQRFAPYAGNASATIVETVEKLLHY